MAENKAGKKETGDWGEKITCEYLVESSTIEDAIKVIKKYELHEIEDKDNLHSDDS